jgi:S1-C subfamily serine protease
MSYYGQEPASWNYTPEPPRRRKGNGRRRTAAGAAVALGVAFVAIGATRVDDVHVASLLSKQSSTTAASSANVASSVNGALVDIVTTEAYQNEEAAGTGMILTSTGEILTNNHVVDGATSIKVTVVSTGRVYKASVVGTDPTDDVAVIQLANASGLKTLPIGDASSVKVGQSVVARGNAGGAGGTPSEVKGSITGLNKSITASDEGGGNAEKLSGLIETDAPIVAGDSGGALATTAGKVIGMDTAASASNAQAASLSSSSQASADSDAYAIPIQTALSIADKIESGKASSTIHIGLHGFLGVELAGESTSGSGYTGRGNSGSFGMGGNGFFGGEGGYFSGGLGNEGFGSSSGSDSGSQSTQTTSGATVAGVIDGGAVASSGLAGGDVITSVNGKTVDSASALNTIMLTTKPGQKITLGWTDSLGQHQTAKVTLGSAAAD